MAFFDDRRRSRQCGDPVHLGLQAGDRIPVVFYQRWKGCCVLLLRIFNDTGSTAQAYLFEHIEILLHLGDMGVFQFGAFLYLAHGIGGGIVMVDLHVAEVELSPTGGAARIGSFGDEFPLADCLAVVFHPHTVMVEPEFAVA